MNNVNDVRNAAEALVGGFLWSGTKQGYEYWEAIHAELREIGEQFEQKELEVTQFDLIVGQKFRFVGDSIRSKEDPERVMVKVTNFYGSAETYFMDVENFEVYSFHGFAETLIPID